MNNINNCPICNNTAEIRINEGYQGNPRPKKYFVVCRNLSCLTQTARVPSLEEALGRWNDRISNKRTSSYGTRGCPFCASPTVPVTLGSNPKKPTGFQVQCHSCGTLGNAGKNPAQVLEHWNSQD